MNANDSITSDANVSSPPSTKRRRLELVAAIAINLVLVTIALIPKGFQGHLRILGHHDSDVVKHYWNLWWFKQMILVDGHLPYRTDYLNYPDGFLLYPIEPLNGLMTLLMGDLFGLPWTTNLLAVLNLAFAGIGMFTLVRFLTGRFWPSICAGLFYALSSYGLWTVYVGVGELSHLGWMPLALLFLLRTARDGGWRNVLPGTLLFFVTAFACWYYALFLFLTSGILILTDPWRSKQTLRLWVRYLIILGVSMGCLLPIQKAFDVSYRATDRAEEGLVEFIRHRIDASPHDSPTTRLDLEQLLIGGPAVKHQTLQNPYIAGRFVGLSAWVLTLLALILRPRDSARWFLVLCTMAGLGIGSRIVIGGAEVGPLLPFAYFNLALEWFSQPMNFPARFVMPTTLALAVLTGLGLGVLGEWLEGISLKRFGQRAGLLTAIFVAGLGSIPVLEMLYRGDVPLPIPSHRVEPLAAARVLEKEPGPMAVIEFPQLYEEGRRSRDAILLMQVVHGKKSSSLPLDRISTFVMSARQVVRGNGLIRSLLVLNGMNGPDELLCCEDLPTNDPSIVLQRKWLESRGFRRLIVTYTEMSPGAVADIKAFCRRIFGPPLYVDDYQEIYEIKEMVEVSG